VVLKPSGSVNVESKPKKVRKRDDNGFIEKILTRK
jgi:hypothetical protein